MTNKQNNWYFGEGNWEQVSNKYMTYKSVLNEDEIIIRTNNIKVWNWDMSGKYPTPTYLYMVGSNKAVYVKGFCVKPAKHWDEEHQIMDEFYLVKLNRKYFKAYEFKENFEGMCFDGKEYSFDDLKAIAKDQEAMSYEVAC